ncbi:hypothetical protein CAPTEDRAFT_220287 [Capitella teleta]|uniref:Mitochondrial import inner membrane translocase subunit TIM50 n=1 Tax=Capitella teleta TaxID=283909 RepID=R7UL70_CAPTE|nr:hypothetical protein CAPTEDRAFT_220287 [Capitella teleta]|eukprot:ELU04538.1 hypothetical protein CAPTEDRAFT_220287 [Capitella teleta]
MASIAKYRRQTSADGLVWLMADWFRSPREAIDFSQSEQKAPADTTAAQESEKSQDKKEDKKEKKDDEKNTFFHKYGVWLGLGSMTLSFLSAGGYLYLYVWGPPAKDGDGNEIVDQYSHLPWWKAYLKRTLSEAHFFKKMIQEPSSKQLLPDPLQEPWYQPPYTLVLELTGVLLHPDWTLNTGWRFKKRPAVEYFLQQVGPPLFEVVLYTHEQGFTASALVDGLDPNGYISFRLFRDATRYDNGVHVKDLDCLNRDLSKVIIVDCDPQAVAPHKRNSIGLKKWTGNDDDRNLVDLAHFLKTIATSGVDDVRSVLDFYNQSDDPLEAFKQNQIRLQEELEQQQAMKAQERAEKKSLVGNWGSLGISGRRG